MIEKYQLIAMKKPLVSVIIATYNREKFIAECIQSVLAQTYSDIEVIVSDDGSSDATLDVVSAIGDDRLTYSRIEHSGIPSVTRNNGIKLAGGNYLAFLDSDDLWVTDKLEQQMAVLEEKKDVGMVCTNGINFNKDGVLGLKNRTPLTDADFTFDSLLEFNHIIASSVILRKDIMDDVGRFDESPELKAAEDYHMWLRAAKKYGVHYMNDPLVMYRTHSDVIRQDSLEDNYRLMKNVFNNLLENKVMAKEQYDSALAGLEQTIEYDNIIKDMLKEKRELEDDVESLFSRISKNKKISKKDKTKLIMRLMMRKISPKLADKLAKRLYSMK